MILAASGVILKERKILLLQRSHYTENYPGFWGCPGGRAEGNETPEQNVIREVWEECNLSFRPTEILKTGIWKNRSFYRFLGEWEGTIRIQEEEVAAYGWFDYKSACQLNLSFDYRDVIEILHKKDYL